MIDPKKLDMATSGVVLCETDDFYALPCHTVNEMHTYFQPIKNRMCHVTRIQVIHIIAIWCVSGLSPKHEGPLLYIYIYIYIYILLTTVVPTGREEVDFSWKPIYVHVHTVYVT